MRSSADSPSRRSNARDSGLVRDGQREPPPDARPRPHFRRGRVHDLWRLRPACHDADGMTRRNQGDESEPADHRSGASERRRWSARSLPLPPARGPDGSTRSGGPIVTGPPNDTVSRGSDYPYAQRFTATRGMPSEGRAQRDSRRTLDDRTRVEDAFWETGKCSGTMYCGDHEHYDFLNRAFVLFSHVNVLQCDLCPSQTRFEGEIIAVTLDMLHGDANTSTRPVGLVTNGGTEASCTPFPPTARQDDDAASRDRSWQVRDRAPRVRQGVSPLRVECRNALVNSSDGRLVRLPKPRSGAASPSMPDRCLAGRHSPAIGDHC